MNLPPGYTNITPYIFAENAEEYITFLVHGLGAEEIGRTVTPDGTIANCEIRIGTAMIMVSQSSDDYPASLAAHYVYVENADESMARAIEHGAKLQMAVADMPYGDRQGGVVDLGGNIWWISQRLTSEPYQNN